jgi:hypothetical protein
MACAALAMRVPRPGWKPAGWDHPPATENQKQVLSLVSASSVHIDHAARTPQFWMLWTALACNITAGISVIGCASMVMKDIFGNALPHIANNAL